MLHDLRYAARALARARGFTVIAVLALALGIGANSAVFSVVYAVLLKPLPYPDPERLVRLYEVNPALGVDYGQVSAGTFVDWRARNRTLESLSVYTLPTDGQTLWTFGERIEPVRIARVSPSLFRMLGVAPLLGRTFLPEAEQTGTSGEGRNVVISFGLWQRAFGGATDILERSVRVEDRFSARIIGVMPRGFTFPEGAEAWANQAFPGQLPNEQRRARTYLAVGRLASGASIGSARAELAAISAQLASEQPDSNRGWTAGVEPLSGSDTFDTRAGLLLLLGSVFGVLLIGCANVANLSLARAMARRHEMRVRIALGAGTGRLIRQCLSEALLLCALALGAGLLIAASIRDVLVRLAPADIPRLGDARVDQVVILFAIALGALCVVAVGLAPAIDASRRDRTESVRAGSRSATTRGARARRWLIGCEVALGVLLLSGALLLVRTFVKLRGVDLGFQPAQVLNVQTRWPVGALFPAQPGVSPWPHIQRAVDGLLAAVAGVNGVDSVGLVSDVPLTGDAFDGAVWRADAPGAHGLTPPADPRDRWTSDLSIVTPGYFRAMGMSFVRGRNFDVSDRFTDEQLTGTAPPRMGSVIVNNAFAAAYFPGQDAVGRKIVLNDDREFGAVRTIVGVVTDVHARAVAESAHPAAYIPHGQHPDVFVPSLLVRTTLPFNMVAEPIRARIHTYDPRLLVQRIRPMTDIVSNALSRPRFNLTLLASFAGVALALSALGIYGVLAYLVVQRTREVGIRMALGARSGDILRLMVREGMSAVLVGACAGVAASLIATRAMRSLLFGVTPLDPLSLAGAPMLLIVVALAACYVPARRALRVDPLVALREE